MDIFDFENPTSASNRNVIRVFSAIIESISRDRNATLVTISYTNCVGCTGPSNRVRLVVNQDTAIYDERGRMIRANDLQRGMSVDASFSSTMTRSIPPQSQAYFIRITARAGRNVTTTGRIVEVNTRNNFITVLRSQNLASLIRFNITDNTVILDPIGRRIRLSALTPGFRVRVEHASFMTASIPPQTTAFTIRIIR